MIDLGVEITKRNSEQWDVSMPDFPELLVWKNPESGWYYYSVSGVAFYKKPDDILRLVEDHHQEEYRNILEIRGGSAAQ